MAAEIHRIRPDDEPLPATICIEAEQAVLGTALLDSNFCGAIQRAGGEQLFAEPVHARIFAIAAERERAQMLVSPVTVATAMASDPGLAELGGAGYVARLAGATNTTLARGYLEMLADLRAKRTMVAAMAAARDEITTGEEAAVKIAGRLEAALLEASVAAGNAGPVSMLKAAATAMEQVAAAYRGEPGDAVMTGISALDQILGGLHPGEMILLGGRPSMGKTAVALSIATRAARAGHHVAIASLEMNPEAMALRAIAEATAEAGTAAAYADIRRGAITAEQMQAVAHAACHTVGELPITFLPRHYSDIGALMAGAKQIHRIAPSGLRLLIVDYAQLLRSQARGRYEQITEISIALKALAGQLNVPVLALSQLSRAVEQRDDKRPTLSDLRESGQLEQDADAVLFCYRDEYYLQREKPDDDDLELLADWTAAMDRARNRLDIIVAKQRQGEVGTARLRFNPATNLIWEDRW